MGSDGVLWRLPDHVGRTALRIMVDQQEADPESALAGLSRLEAARLEKREREGISAIQAASSRGDGSEPQGRLEVDDDEAVDLRPARLLTRVAADAAGRFGTALHRVLEAWPLSTQPGAYLRSVAADRAGWLSARDEEDFGADFSASLNELASSRIADRLEELGLAGALLARELPILLRSGETVITGAIDMLYRDPESQELVVADFKTDRVENGGEDKSKRYAEQGQSYVEAVAKAFGLNEREVRFELWMLDADLVKVVRLN